MDRIKVHKKDQTMYPSANLIENICYNEYARALDTYDKIYEKVNIALAFSGIVLIVILGDFDYSILLRLFNTKDVLALFTLLLYFVCSIASCILIVYSTIRLLLLMRSKTMNVISVLDLCNTKMYYKSEEITSLWVSDKYVKSIETIRNETVKKQKVFDHLIIKTVIAIVCYAIALMIKKGV